MFLTSVNDSMFLLLSVVLVCVRCDDSKIYKANSSLEGNHKIFFNVVQNHSVEHDTQNMNSSTGPDLKLHKETESSSHLTQNKISSELIKKSSEDEIQKNDDYKGFNQSKVPLEGGGSGVLVQPQINKTNNPTIIEEPKDSTLASGSKGRKGVKFPVSSVVPRKGVSLQPFIEGEGKPIVNTTSTNNLVNINGVMVHHSTTNNQANSGEGKKLMNETHFSQSSQKPVQSDVTKGEVIKKVHSKKPEYVSDEGDADYSDKYSLIHTSTTGEDYVIIGIVIVIGIWFSVFGALIFYRRAGEYWDRRHYRRMDFLVEGMYND